MIGLHHTPPLMMYGTTAALLEQQLHQDGPAAVIPVIAGNFPVCMDLAHVLR